MKRHSPVALLLTILIFLGAVAFRPRSPASASLPGPRASVTTGSNMAAHGTAWVPQQRGALSKFKPFGWGTQVRAKAAGDQWVHISVPTPTMLDGTSLQVDFVRFCAQSSHGSATKPTRLDLWNNNVQFWSADVTWAANNTMQCFVNLPTLTPISSLGFSVLLHFANAKDVITLYKAEAQFIPAP